MKKLILVIALMSIMTACGSRVVEPVETAKATETDKSKRFVVSDDGVSKVTDTKYGCEYIKTGGYTSWTYVHGSCTDVIAKESGK